MGEERLPSIASHQFSSGESIMKRLILFFMYATVTFALAGCGTTTINPNYSSANPDLMFIGGEPPAAKAPETLNLGSYCLNITEKWKKDGKTPDGQTIWTKDSFRKVVPCR
jgi:hypothetical protein